MAVHARADRGVSGHRHRHLAGGRSAPARVRVGPLAIRGSRAGRRDVRGGVHRRLPGGLRVRRNPCRATGRTAAR